MKRKLTKRLCCFMIALIMMALLLPVSIAQAYNVPTLKVQCTRYNQTTGEGQLQISLLDFYNASGANFWGGAIKLAFDSNDFDLTYYYSLARNVKLGSYLYDYHNSTAFNSGKNLLILNCYDSSLDHRLKSNNIILFTVNFKATSSSATIDIPYVDLVAIDDDYNSWGYGSVASYSPINYSVSSVPGINITHPGLDSIDDISDDVVSQLDSMLSSITLCNETISGPTYNIFGYDFCPLKFNAKAVLDFSGLSKNITIDEDNKTVHVMLGKKQSGNANIVQTTKTCDASWSKQYNEVKNLYKTMTGYNLSGRDKWNAFEKMKGSLNTINCDMIISAQMQCCAYLDFDYNSGTLKLKEGGIVQSASLGISFPHTIVPKLLFATLKLTGSESGTISAVMSSNGKLTPQMSIEPAITATASLKGQVPYLGSLEGGLDATLAVLLQTFDPRLTVRMSGKFFVYGTLGNKRVLSRSYPYANFELYPNLQNNLSLSTMTIASENSREVYSDADSLDRSYLYAVMPMSIEADDAIYTLSGIYPNNGAQLIKLAGSSMMLVWNGDDGTKSDINRTSLMYSIYKNGLWSAPQIIFEDGTATGEFKVVGDEEKIYIVYQKFTEILADDISVEEMLTKSEIYAIKYEEGMFSQPVCLTDYENEIYEYINDVNYSNNRLHITWIENSENDLFMSTGKTSVKTVSLDENLTGNVKEVASLSSDNKMYLSDTYISDDSIYYIIYSHDTEQSTLWKYHDGTSKEVFSGEYIYNIESVNNEMYYIKNSQIYKYDGEKETVVLSIAANEFKIISNGTYTSMLISVSEGAGNDIYISNLENHGWSQPETFTDLDKYIRSFSPFMYDDGTISIAAAVAEINDVVEENDEVYGTTSIMVLNQCKYFDVSTSYVYCENDSIEPGQNISLCFDVTNDSLEEITEIDAIISGENVTTVKETISCNIAPYQTEQLTVQYRLPENLTRTTLTLELISDKDEKDYSNNKVSVDIARSNVILSPAECIVNNDNSAQVKLVILNEGYEKAEDIIIKVYNGNANNEIIHEESIGDLDVGEKYNFKYNFPQDMAVTEQNGMKNVVYISAETSTEEENYSDNEQKVTFKNYSDTYSIEYSEVETSYVKLKIKSSANAAQGKIFCGIYDSNDKLLRCIIKSTEDIDSEGTLTFNWNDGECSSFKIFVWDSQMIPLTDNQPSFEL